MYYGLSNQIGSVLPQSTRKKLGYSYVDELRSQYGSATEAIIAERDKKLQSDLRDEDVAARDEELALQQDAMKQQAKEAQTATALNTIGLGLAAKPYLQSGLSKIGGLFGSGTTATTSAAGLGSAIGGAAVGEAAIPAASAASAEAGLAGLTAGGQVAASYGGTAAGGAGAASGSGASAASSAGGLAAAGPYAAVAALALMGISGMFKDEGGEVYTPEFFFNELSKNPEYASHQAAKKYGYIFDPQSEYKRQLASSGISVEEMREKSRLNWSKSGQSEQSLFDSWYNTQGKQWLDTYGDVLKNANVDYSQYGINY